jgi:hypothetical protein
MNEKVKTAQERAKRAQEMIDVTMREAAADRAETARMASRMATWAGDLNAAQVADLYRERYEKESRESAALERMVYTLLESEEQAAKSHVRRETLRAFRMRLRTSVTAMRSQGATGGR